MRWALQQIEGWQRAQKKLPTWAQTEGVLFPPHLSMEQCSSEQTARYKAEIAEGGEEMTDLTAGFGVDATMLGRRFDRLLCVEQNGELCEIVRNNLPLLGIKNCEVVCGKAEAVLRTLHRQSLIFIDPARRDNNGGKVVSIVDCTPDVVAMQDDLMAHADTVMVKLSPMLDLKCVERELKQVAEVHIVSVDNECKEVLVVLSHDASNISFHCVNLTKDGTRNVFTFTREDETEARCDYADEMGTFIYEPNASIMKAGCYKLVASRYRLRKLNPNSHLYTSYGAEPVKGFPGRVFKVDGVSGFNKKDLRAMLANIEKANLAVRNFPMSVAELRKKLKLREGGTDYLFATTMADDSKVLIFSSSFS